MPRLFINAEVAQSPMGANCLFYLPYLMGERTPHLDPNCRGVFFGLSAMHQKRDLLRAVMEGVSYSLRDCLSVLCQMEINPNACWLAAADEAQFGGRCWRICLIALCAWRKAVRRSRIGRGHSGRRWRRAVPKRERGL